MISTLPSGWQLQPDKVIEQFILWWEDSMRLTTKEEPTGLFGWGPKVKKQYVEMTAQEVAELLRDDILPPFVKRIAELEEQLKLSK